VTRRRLVLATTVVVTALVLSGCGDDPSDSSGPAAAGDTTVQAGEGLPPADYAELEAIFEPMLEPLGLTLTRGALIDRSDNGYKVSDDGRHLALYAAPVDEDAFTPEASLTTFYDVTALLAPYVFEQWSDLESFDICQEPPDTVDDRPEPFPETQIDLPRAAAEAFDWDNRDLADLLYLDLSEADVRTVFGERTRDNGAYVTAYEAAQQRVVATVTTVDGSESGTGTGSGADNPFD
jgi:hypothetical protein